MGGIKVDVHNTRRFHLVRFHRATNGASDAKYPDPDDRGYLTGEFGPVVSVLVGRTVTVRLERLSIHRGAPLYVKSSDTAAFTVHNPHNGRVRSGQHADIEITGVAGANPRIAKLEVHFDSLTGPIIHELTVWVYTQLTVAVIQHVVSIAGTPPPAPAGAPPGAPAPAAPPAVPSTMNLAPIIPRVNRVWEHYGITLTLNSPVHDTVTFATAGVLDDRVPPTSTDVPTLLGTNWIPGAVNVYTVKAFLTPDLLGLGISRQSMSIFSAPNPGIILSDSAATDPALCAHTLAHEIGHFFRLWHPDQMQPPIEREDTWSRRRLMHNFAFLSSLSNWKDDVGYGAGKAGQFVTLKHLAQHSTDGESPTARGTVGGAAGPY